MAEKPKARFDGSRSREAHEGGEADKEAGRSMTGAERNRLYRARHPELRERWAATSLRHYYKDLDESRRKVRAANARNRCGGKCLDPIRRCAKRNGRTSIYGVAGIQRPFSYNDKYSRRFALQCVVGI